MAKTYPSGLFRKGKRLREPVVDVPVIVVPEPEVIVVPVPEPEPVPEPTADAAVDPQPLVEGEGSAEPVAEVVTSTEDRIDFSAMNVKQTIEWAGDDPDRRAVALAAEQARVDDAGNPAPRKGVLKVLAPE